MADAAISWIEQLERHFRLQDLFDIALISVFIYLLLTWFKTTASRSMVLGVLVVCVVYGLARIFDMYLTALLLRTGLTVALVALVVIFQEDLRQGFERIARFSPFGSRTADEAGRSADLLVEGLTMLASMERGALVVLEGDDPLDRHLSPGIELDGEMSVPLLCSIFDPHSPGHDGAVVIDGARISRFAVHLPLSTNVQQTAGLGTRHAAALGLSERSDALVVAVSEERGTISLAERGRLHETGTAAELKARFADFFNTRFPQPHQSPWNWRLWRHAPAKLFSVLLASVAWLLFAYQTETVQRTFELPIEYRNLPPNWRLGEPEPELARVTLSGSERAFDLVDAGGLKVSVDLAHVRQGVQSIPLNQRHVNSPSDLSVQQIEPRELSLEAYRVVTAEVPVQPVTRGRLADHLELAGLSVSPSAVRVSVDARDRPKLERLRAPIDLDAINQTQTVRTRLLVPSGVRHATPEVLEADVTVQVQPKAPEQ